MEPIISGNVIRIEVGGLLKEAVISGNVSDLAAFLLVSDFRERSRGHWSVISRIGLTGHLR